ncbi:hypothetical protein BH10CYA1_BH10CYA1_19490 [soil metagenome]
MSKLIPSLAVATFILFLFLYGACISGIVLKEPDICFLLASGKWIIENGHLPATDPFSYSTIYHNQPYVIEKWLTEIIFFGLWKWTSAAGLLVFDAIILTLTFTIMPYRFLKLNGVSGLKALLLTSLSTFTSFCHLAVRPEIFSYLIVAFYLEILMRLRDRNSTFHYPSVIALVLLMALWSNLHTLFIVGLMILAFYCSCLVLERLLKFTDAKMDWTVPIALALCIPATLATPYGITLWQYLPNIFGPFNDTNNEMQSIGLANLTSISLYPFFILIAVSMVIFFKHALVKPTKSGELFFKLLLPAGIVGGIKTIRTIPISDLFATAGMAQILGMSPVKRSAIDEKIDELCQPMQPFWIIMTLAVAGFGAYAMTFVIPPDIPQGSAAFQPPLKAIEFIDKNRPVGRMLNDPHFGNVLMWKVDKTPPVFIDSRYNLYGNTLLQDYWTMAENKAGAQQLLDKYSIDWIFLNPKMQLVKALSQDPQWTVLYQDSEAAIVARKSHKQGN